MSNLDSCFERLARIALADPGRRGVAELAQPGALEAACNALIGAKRIGIVTGFFIPAAGVCETDGPLGTAHLAHSLRHFASVVVCTDRLCLPVVRSLIPDAVDDPSTLEGCDILVSVERLGRARDGRYYSMRGGDQSEFTAPLDEYFLATKDGRATIGVGDGGNEIGMGRVREAVLKSIPNGETIGSIVPTDHLVVAGVSNWGAWALAAAVGLQSRSPSLPTTDQAFEDLQSLVAAGAVDGVTGRNEPTVDGLDWPVHADVLLQLRAVAGQ